MIMEDLLSCDLLVKMVCFNCSGQFSSAGCSGMYTRSAPHATAAFKANQPHFLPMTSMTKSLRWEVAVEVRISIAVQIRSNALSQPIVMEVLPISLSILPTNPTMCSVLISYSRPSQFSLNQPLLGSFGFLLTFSIISSTNSPQLSKSNWAPVKEHWEGRE